MLLQSHIDAWRKHCARTAWRSACQACRRTRRSALFQFELLAEFAYRFRLALLGATLPLDVTEFAPSALARQQRPAQRGGALQKTMQLEHRIAA